MPIRSKFHVEPHWDRGTKVYSNGPGHMTKMAAMPIYGKQVAQKATIAHLSPMCQGQSGPRPYATFPPPQ